MASLDDSRNVDLSTEDDNPIVEMADEGTIPPCATRRKASFAHTDIIKYRRSFDGFDFNKDGTVQASDLEGIINKLGYRITQEQINEILINNELDESSFISFETFLDIIPRNYEQIPEEEHKLADLREKFQRYDLDQNGVISLQEAQWALQVELKVTPQTALRLLNQFIKLDYEHFVTFYKKVQDKKLEIYDKFGRYDENRDGLISSEEAHKVLHEELGFTQERSTAMVDKFDMNRDGQVSYMEFAEFYIAVEEKKEKIRQAFRHFDLDGKGFVSNKQAEQILKGLLGFSDDKCKKAIDTYDKNKDGNINYEEFLEFYSMLEEERQRLLTEFNRYDSNQDGKISFEEFREMLTKQGYTDKQIETLMTGYDSNKDGHLDFDEFKQFLNFS